MINATVIMKVPMMGKDEDDVDDEEVRKVPMKRGNECDNGGSVEDDEGEIHREGMTMVMTTTIMKMEIKTMTGHDMKIAMTIIMSEGIIVTKH